MKDVVEGSLDLDSVEAKVGIDGRDVDEAMRSSI